MGEVYFSALVVVGRKEKGEERERGRKKNEGRKGKRGKGSIFLMGVVGETYFLGREEKWKGLRGLGRGGGGGGMEDKDGRSCLYQGKEREE